MDLESVFLPVADATGASVDQIQLIFCLLFAFPLGSVFVRIPSTRPGLKHLFNIGITLFFFFPVLKAYAHFFQLLGSTLVTFVMAKFIRSSNMPWMVFFIVMGHLTVNHVLRVYRDDSSAALDVTGPQMVLTMKLTTFAWNVHDGRRAQADLDKWQLSKRVVAFPTLLEFLGYAFYFPGILVGPYLEYHDYMELITERLYDNLPVKDNVTRKLPKGRKRVAYSKMVLGLMFLGGYVLLATKYNYRVTLQPAFAKMPLLQRLFWFQIYAPSERVKYYAVWTLTEGAAILTGFGFTGFNAKGKSTWNGAANVKPLDVELPLNFKGILDSWNMKTNVWLRECVYKRVTPKGKKPGFRSTLTTSLTSAFWHGVYPGYYLTFFLGGLITAAARLARQNFRPFFLPAEGQTTGLSKRIYDLAGGIVSLVVLNYATIPFILLTIDDSLKSWRTLAWYGHGIIVGGLVFFYAGGSKLCKGMQKNMGVAPPPRKVHVQGNGNGDAKISIGELQFPPPIDSIVPPMQ
ncbi:endoplasmic reticulum protein [Cylindrobasidium torrendii FP15055 ss-10]|uniref:Endoplasmic reticulum protein n=1 Tax=Cylindrobasidium torrendii FP15055 ss-10 TaxID=1314674 RepID=A0A0D7BMI4_9AGAR|nr:endoplasmic reticulum protein [Cylindrobasidium torrendii FP15055 ss-10]